MEKLPGKTRVGLTVIVSVPCRSLESPLAPPTLPTSTLDEVGHEPYRDIQDS